MTRREEVATHQWCFKTPTLIAPLRCRPPILAYYSAVIRLPLPRQAIKHRIVSTTHVLESTKFCERLLELLHSNKGRVVQGHVWLTVQFSQLSVFNKD